MDVPEMMPGALGFKMPKERISFVSAAPSPVSVKEKSGSSWSLVGMTAVALFWPMLAGVKVMEIGALPPAGTVAGAGDWKEKVPGSVSAPMVMDSIPEAMRRSVLPALAMVSTMVEEPPGAAVTGKAIEVPAATAFDAGSDRFIAGLMVSSLICRTRRARGLSQALIKTNRAAARALSRDRRCLVCTGPIFFIITPSYRGDYRKRS
jgi:hypothetical protein